MPRLRPARRRRLRRQASCDAVLHRAPGPQSSNQALRPCTRYEIYDGLKSADAGSLQMATALLRDGRVVYQSPFAAVTTPGTPGRQGARDPDCRQAGARRRHAPPARTPSRSSSAGRTPGEARTAAMARFRGAAVTADRIAAWLLPPSSSARSPSPARAGASSTGCPSRCRPARRSPSWAAAARARAPSSS